MRPILLEMTAFGSYAEKTAVPFSELKHGLYLVTGDTGAGKTTIFDAIMFALYGEASGQDRKAEMMHCDHVPKSVDTEVRLRFSQNGKDYTVTRTIHFRKKRGTENEYTDYTIGAQLVEPDAAPTDGANRVTARCQELIGLDREQFRKIVMLAQGEFREFLKADSSKKSDILGKLFDNTAYQYIQNLLGGTRDELRRRRTRTQEELRQLMQSSFRLPEENAQDAELYLPEHPQLRENLAALIADEEARLKAQENKRNEARRAADALNTQKGAADELNRRFDELESKRRRENELSKQKEAIEARRIRLTRADAALHTAQPKIDRFTEAQRTLDTARKRITELEEKLAETAREAAEAQAVVDGDEPQRELAQELEAGIQRIVEQLPDYRTLQAEAEAKSAAEKASAAARAAREAGERAIRDTEAAIVRQKEELAALEDIEIRVERYKAALDEKQKRLAALTGENGLRNDIRGIRAAEDALAEKERAFRAAAEKALSAEQEHHALYQRFIAGQAGILAKRLAHDLDENGQAECPVCRTRLGREHIPALAPLREDTPTQAQVDAAKNAYDAAEADRRVREKDAGSLQSDIAARKAAVLTRAEALLPGAADWEVLSDDTRMDELCVSLTEDAAAEEEYRAALRRQEDKLRRKAELEKLEASLPSQRKAVEEAVAAERKAEADIGAHDAVLRQLRERLDHENEAAAEARKQELEDKKTAVLQLLQEHRDALDEASRKHAVAGDLLTRANEALPTQEAAAAEARDAMDGAIASAGFADAAEVRAALLPLDGSDTEAWLRAEREALADYDGDVKHTREDIERLAAYLADKARVDAEALTEALTEADAVYAEANRRCSDTGVLLSEHRAVLDRAGAYLDGLASTRSAWERIERLGDLAVGTSSDGGKLSFDRYVMGTVFREILEMANRRLDIMSGGRYELVHRADTDRRNAKAGLEIDVLDLSTGQRRPSGSLSGGETFITSLALALGLSDVVQNHAGGKPLDALFIDEGFGSLSDGVLDKALDVLNQLTEGDRLVGIISHVNELKARIDKQIVVTKDRTGGSRLEVIV